MNTKQRVWCWLDPEVVKTLQHQAIDKGQRLSEYLAEVVERIQAHAEAGDDK